VVMALGSGKTPFCNRQRAEALRAIPARAGKTVTIVRVVSRVKPVGRWRQSSWPAKLIGAEQLPLRRYGGLNQGPLLEGGLEE
jgi:hypothetical protein